MKRKIKRFLTLVKKDVRDCFTEKTALLMTAVPVVFALVFRLLFSDGGYGDMAEWITLVCLLFNLSLLPLSVLPLLIGEEKEQGTVPALLRAGVTPAAFLGSKALTALIVELFCSFLICLINGVTAQIGLCLLCNLLAALTLLPIGGLVGILAKDKNTVNVYSSFPVFFMMLAPIFFFLGSPLQTIKKFFPSTLLTEVLQPMFLGEAPPTSDLILASLVTAVWIAAGWTVFFWLFRRYGLKTA